MLPKHFKKVILLVLVVIALSTPVLTFAVDPTPEPGQLENAANWSKAHDAGYVDSKLNMEYYHKLSINDSVLSLTKSLGNYPPSEDPELNKIYEGQSLLNQTSQAMATLYEHPPAGAGIWLADVTSNLGLVPKAYAQGIGFSALSPLLPIWKVFRNVAYAILIIILLVVGLMIMFRTKIDPRTVISVQSALPRIVITIILITFSYPIAGLMIDLMYVLMFLGINVIASSITFHTWSGETLKVAEIQGQFLNGGLLAWLFGPIPTSFWISGAVGLFSIILVPFKAGTLAGNVVKSFSAATKVGTAGNILGGALGINGLLVLLVIIVFLFALIRLIFILLNAYIQILINIVFAPIFLLGQAIPGQSSFSSWIRNLLSNIIVFPATAILLMVANAISDAFIKPSANLLTGFTDTKDLWTPPILPGLGADLAQILIGLGFALVIPQIVVSIKNMFKAKAAIPIGPSAITGPLLGGAQQALQYVYYGKTLFAKREGVQPVATAKPSAKPSGG